jgi:N-acetylmuramoyl-L-alanine amidase
VKPRLIVLLAILIGSFTGVIAWRWANAAPATPAGPESATATSSVDAAPGGSATPAPTTTEPSPLVERLAYVTTRRGTPLATEPGGTGTPVAGGILLPVLAETQGGYRIFDVCNQDGWVDASEVDPGMVPAEPEPGRFDEAIFVIDPGHGVPDYGAVGPSGLTETEVNLDVASRVVDLLGSPHTIDWDTGQIAPGDEIPPAATAVLTRGPDGPNEGDYQLGLTYRATVANALDATALVSIHHNTVPEMNLDHPGSEAFVSADNPESPRLGGLIVEELRTALARFDADWTGSPGDGLISRVDGEGDDYYTILNRAEVPAVIIEGAYISNPTEEALAMTDEFRQAYAEAVYRGMVRFVTTDDYPIPAPEPDLWEVDRPAPSMSDCRVPPP